MIDRLVDIFLSGIVQGLTILLLAKLGLFPMLAIYVEKKEFNDYKNPDSN